MPRLRRHPLSFTLAGLPELELFESDEQRQQALAEIAAEAGNLKSGGYWLGVAIFAGAMIGAVFMTKAMLRLVAWPLWIEKVLVVGPPVLVGWFTLRYLHLRGMTTAVRQKLLDRNIAVCMKCGYALRGLPVSVGRCPECGRPFDERVLCILTRATELAGEGAGDVRDRHSAD